jgi:ankyrin repeat protein
MKLLEHGADADYCSTDGRTPLVAALRNNKYMIACYLIHRGARLATPESDWGQPLENAVSCMRFRRRKGDFVLRVVKYILDKGGDVNAINSNGFRPLNYAVAFDRPEVIALLLQKGAVMSPHTMVSPYHPDRFDYLRLSHLTQVQNRPDSYKRNPHAWVTSSSQSHFEQAQMSAVRVLLQGGCVLNTSGIDEKWSLWGKGDKKGTLDAFGTALHAAYASGNFAVAEQLERAGAYTNIKDAQVCVYCVYCVLNPLSLYHMPYAICHMSYAIYRTCIKPISSMPYAVYVY